MQLNIDFLKTNRFRKILTYIKYGGSLAVTIFALTGMHNWLYFWGSLLELAVIFLLSNMLSNRYRKTAYVINGILLLLYNVQQFVLYFGSTYLTMIMVSNLSSVQDLGGRAAAYITSIVLVVIFSFLPIYPFQWKKVSMHNVLTAILIIDLGFTMTVGNTYSPLYDYVMVSSQANEEKKRQDYIASLPDRSKDFYHKNINDSIEKPADLPDQPNIILIFTEGLSQSIVSDDREIMPNVASYEKKSLFFKNYYNHTAATYRGLIGQLYSGYQYNNLDENHLISLQKILQDQGYYTSFINSEPNNMQFTSYLNTFGFDDVISKNSDEYLTDKETYELLGKTVTKQKNSDQPFFTAVYTFNTHVSLDSDDEVYGDGTDAELNKFYNCDYQFGKFMKFFNSSELADNTIVVFTADHCTYADDAFRDAFPDAEREDNFVDQIPLFIYYKGIEADTLDTDGRNSLCLAPTILDYIDISEPNYFLGTSLFTDINSDTSPYDTVYTIENDMLISTRDGDIQPVDSSIEKKMKKNINSYYSVAQQNRD